MYVCLRLKLTFDGDLFVVAIELVSRKCFAIVVVHSNVFAVAAATVAGYDARNRLQPHILDVSEHGISCVVCMLRPSGNLYRKVVVLGAHVSIRAYLRQ